MAWKTFALGCVLAVAGLTAFGYAVALGSLGSCERDVYREVQRKGVVGRDLSGNEIALTERDMHAEIAGPFLVDVSYLVPFDLHGSVRTQRYFVFPGFRHLLASETVDLVGVPDVAPELRARSRCDTGVLCVLTRATRQSVWTSIPRNAA